MGVNLLGDKKLRALRRATGDDTIVRALTYSHHESGRYIEFVTAAHVHGCWDKRTGDLEYYFDERGDRTEHCWSSCEAFRSFGGDYAAWQAWDKARRAAWQEEAWKHRDDLRRNAERLVADVDTAVKGDADD